MESTSYVSVKIDELQTACELWLDDRETKVKNKIKKAIEDAMLEDINSWWKKKLKYEPKYRTKEEATDYVYDYQYHNGCWYERTIADKIGMYSQNAKNRIQKILFACKSPHLGFVTLSVEDNALLEGFYQ